MASGSPVKLRVYDLSRGMAAQFSMAVIGKQIDLVPHTGVEVFGREYFFGGGIQVATPAHVEATYGMQPAQVIDVGTTSKTPSEFGAWLREQSPRYTAATYSLMTHNCNNFSDAVLRFLTDGATGVPDWILSLPQEALSSPAGAMLRPVIEQQERAMREAGGDLGALMGGVGGAAAGGAGAGGVPSATPVDVVTAAPARPLSELLAGAVPVVASDASALNAAVSHVLAAGEGLDADQRGALRTALVSDNVSAEAMAAAVAAVSTDAATGSAARARASALAILSIGLGTREEDAEATETETEAVALVTRLAVGGGLSALESGVAWTALANAAASPALWVVTRSHEAWGELLGAALQACGSGPETQRRAASAWLLNAATAGVGEDAALQLAFSLLDAMRGEQDTVAARTKVGALGAVVARDDSAGARAALEGASVVGALTLQDASALEFARAVDAVLRE